MMRHQKLALAWMSRREEALSGVNGGILADDQGLGKTVRGLGCMAWGVWLGGVCVAGLHDWRC